MLLSELQTGFTLRIDGDNDLSEAKFIAMANDLADMLYPVQVGANTSRYQAEEDYTVSSSPSTQALPTDYQSFNTGDCGIYQMNGTTVVGKLNTVPYGSTFKGYRISGANIVFSGLENASLKLIYVPARTVFTSLSDDFNVPVWFKPMLIQGLVALYYRYEEDFDRESIAWTSFDPLFAQFEAKLKPESQVLLTEDLTQGF